MAVIEPGRGPSGRRRRGDGLLAVPDAVPRGELCICDLGLLRATIAGALGLSDPGRMALAGGAGAVEVYPTEELVVVRLRLLSGPVASVYQTGADGFCGNLDSPALEVILIGTLQRI